MDNWLYAAAVALLLIFGMLAKLADVSISTVNASELAPLMQKLSKKAKRVQRLSEKSFSLASPLKTAITFCEFASLSVCVYRFAPSLVNAFKSLRLNEMLAAALALIVITLAFLLVTVVLIAVVARHIAIRHALSVSLALSGYAVLVSYLFLPLSFAMSALSGSILGLFKINRDKQESSVSEETIKSLVDAGSEMGTIESEEKEFIENVFAFNDVTADDISTHRTGITLLWTNESDEEWDKTIRASHHTNFPICDEKIDNIIGVLSAKAYFRSKDRSRAALMKNAVKAPYFIPETMKANAILKDMRKRREYFALVIDEYGGLSGILTITDLLECIVGDIYENTDKPKTPDIEPLDSKAWMILGRAEIEDVEKALGVTLDGDFDTFAGYVITMLGVIPDDGSVLNVENELMSVRITSVKDKRIEKTMVQLKETAEE